MANKDTIFIGVRCNKDTLAQTPEKILQMCSMKIFARQQQLFDEMRDKPVKYRGKDDNLLKATFIEADSGSAVIKNPEKGQHRVNMKRIIF